MNLVAQLRKLRPEDLDYVHDPFAKMMFINHLATGVGKHVPQAVLNTCVDEVQKWSTTSQAFYLIGTARAKSNKGTKWTCALGLWLHAIAGDDDAFFEILRLFKPVVGASWVQKTVREACLRKDWAFVRKYGEAVAWKYRPHGGENFELNVWLALNWNYGSTPFSKMSDRQILFEATSAGLRANQAPTQREQKSLNQRLKRLGLKR